MTRLMLSALATATVFCTVASPALGGPTDAQLCHSKKLLAAGKFSLCRLKAEAKAAKSGSTPDFSKCDAKLDDKYQKIDAKFGDACPSTPDVSGVQDGVADLTTALSCGSQAAPAGGSIVVLTDVRVDTGSDLLFTVRNSGNTFEHAICFLAFGCGYNDEFELALPRQSEVSWPAGTGSTGSTPILGDLVCVETDPFLSPLPGNRLIVSATSPGQCPIYGTSILGDPDSNDGNNVLCLGGGISAQCPSGAEYDGCPAGIDPSRIEGCWSQTELPSPPYPAGTQLTFLCN